MILADCHNHTSFSGDSESPLENQIEAAIAAGLRVMCVTDHHDPGFPGAESFRLAVSAYLDALSRAQEKYRNQIRILKGIELGLLSSVSAEISAFLQERDSYDFIIGSTHLVDGLDPWETSFWQLYEGTTGYRRYFETLYENICRFDGFDVCGHLDYICRYGRRENRPYDLRAYWDLIDASLRKLIDKGIGLECNTAGMAGAPGNPNPEMAVLRHYRELGGEILTIGSDAHTPERIAFHFDCLPEFLKECGFRYYTVFERHKPTFYPL